jgi:hypothetical protein
MQLKLRQTVYGLSISPKEFQERIQLQYIQGQPESLVDAVSRGREVPTPNQVPICLQLYTDNISAARTPGNSAEEANET